MGGQGDGAGATNPAFMLFGKQIKCLLTKEIKEELSPRGVDERGLSLATSSDEDEDLNESAEATCEVAMVERLKKNNEDPDPMEVGSAQSAKEQWKSQKSFEEDGRILHMQWPKQDSTEIERPPPPPLLSAKQESDKQQIANEGLCTDGGRLDTHTITERELNMEEDQHAGKRQVGLWSQCPRCNSTDTKFCYFNNYNVNQPRHFCKHCQRYWTAGGTLRNVPVGAGKRKNKHALRKEAFFMTPLCGSNKLASLDASAEDGKERIHREKSDSVDVNVNVLADAGPIRNADFPTPQGLSPMVEMPSVNTDLNLCAHGSKPTSCTQNQLTSLNPLPSHKPHSLTTLQQLQMGRFYPSLPSGNSSQAYPDLACMRSRDRPICSYDASGASQMCPVSCSRCSQICSDGCSNVSQLCPQLTGGSAGLCHISPHVQSGSSGSIQISPHARSESAGVSRPSAYWQNGSSELRHIEQNESSANLESGFAKRPPDLVNGVGQECLHLQNRSHEGNPARRKEATTDRKSASPGSGHLPDLAKTYSRFDHGLRVPLGQDKESMYISDSSLVKGAQPNTNLPLWGADGWPYFYNMCWLDTVAPLGFKPILTPQGWALPFIPPSIQPSSSTTHPTSLENLESSHARSTKSTSSTPTPPSFNSTHALMSPTTCQDIPRSAFCASIPSCGKRSIDVSKSDHYDGHHKGYKCSKSAN